MSRTRHKRPERRRYNTPKGTVPEAAESAHNPRAFEFNDAMIEVVLALGGTLVSRERALGYEFIRMTIETRIGTLDVRPSGNCVNCRFHNADKWLANSCNVRTGKWNHYYFGDQLEHAVADFTRTLKSVL